MHISLFILYVYNLYSTHFLKDEMNSNAYKCVHVCVCIYVYTHYIYTHTTIFGPTFLSQKLNGFIAKLLD